MTENNDKALVPVSPELGILPAPATRGNVSAMERFVDMTLTGPNRPPVAQVRALAIVAVKLGLHPLTGEVLLYEGKPFVTIAGRRRLAERQGDLAAVQPDIVIDPDRRRALGARKRGDIVAECKLWRKSSDRPTIQYAIVRAVERWPSANEAKAMGISEAELKNFVVSGDVDGVLDAWTNPKARVRPIVAQPEIMAMKRAEARALDSLAAVPLPTYDENIGAPVGDRPSVSGVLVGENGSDLPATDIPAGEPEQTAVTANGKTAVAQPAEASDIPQSVGDLMTKAHFELGYRSTAQTLGALGLRNLQDVKDPAAAWAELKKLGPVASAEKQEGEE